MESKKTRFVVLVLSVLVFLTGIFFLYPEKIGVCMPTDRECVFAHAFTLGEPLTFGAIPLMLVAFILLFFSQEIFNTWKKFAIVYVPLAIIFIVFQPVTCGSLICTNKESATWMVGIGFLLISLLIILYKKIRLLRQK